MKNIITHIAGFSIVAYKWLVKSSKDPKRLSATLRGSVWFVVVTAIAGALGVSGLDDAFDSAINLIVALGQVSTAVYALYGALRKVTRTLGGKNVAFE